jgi:hypothetical protein
MEEAMNDQLTPQEAAKALRTVDQRAEQALAHGASRWADVVAAVLMFLYCASVDFLPDASWPGFVFAALAIGYAVLIRTRRGAAILGQSARVHRRAISPRFALNARIIIAVLIAGSLATVVFLDGTDVHVPYLSTALGGVLAIILIAFGPQLRARMAVMAHAGQRVESVRNVRR